MHFGFFFPLLYNLSLYGSVPKISYKDPRLLTVLSTVESRYTSCFESLASDYFCVHLYEF